MAICLYSFGSFSILLIPVVYYFLSESVGFNWGQPINAITRINKIFDKLKIANINALPAYENPSNQIPVNKLFNKTYVSSTLKLWIAFSLHLFVCIT